MSLMNKLSHLAKSQQGKDLVEKAKTFANDPKTREKIDDARGKFNEHVETAKQKMAEKKAKDGEAPAGNGSATTPAYGEDSPATTTPPHGEAGPATTTPPHGEAGPATTTPPYGEAGPATTPPYGEDGPKAA